MTPAHAMTTFGRFPRAPRMVQTLKLEVTLEGRIWPRRPLVSSNGLLSCVKNRSRRSYDKRPARFRAVTFNASGDVLAATDERGRVVVLYVTANRYSFVQHLGTGTIHCCFSPTRKTELLVTCEDETVRCIDVQSQRLVSTLRGHKLPVRCTCFQKSGQFALTASQDSVILWDTKDWSRYRVLNAGFGVEEAIFVARGDLVAVCLQDDTVMMWELQSLALKYRFSLPETEQSPGLRTITVSDDHQVLVASGQTPFIYVWDLESQMILRIMELPPPIKQVIRHAFVPGHNTMISILADDGGVIFLDVAAKNPQVQLEISNRGRTFLTFDIECHARYLAASTSDGFLLLYDMDIARQTAARAQERRKKEGLVKSKDHARICTCSGSQKIVSSDDVNPTAESNEADINVPDTREHNRPVSSKLIDSLFGAKYPRKADSSAKQTRSGATTAIYTKSSCTPRASGTKESIRAPTGSLSEPVVANDSSTLHEKIWNRRASPLACPIAQLTAQENEVIQKRLVRFLKCNGMYPKKYRVLVWRFLLRLPKNEEAFRSLVAKGKHPGFIRLKDQYPLQNGRTFRRLHHILSAIVYWCPAFVEVSYLPAVVYPFVRIFRENDLAAFEATVSVLLHWCGEFFVSVPNPPVFAMSAIERELAWQDAQLYNHFTQHQVASESYAWSLLQTIFTEVLSEDEWMCLWDHLFTSSDIPQLLFVAVLAYLSYFRTALLAICDRLSIEQFFHQQNAINIEKFIQLMMSLRDKLDLRAFTAIEDPSASDSTTEGQGRLWPLSRGQYPAFAHRPRLVMDFQTSKRNRIALEEAGVAHTQKVVDHIEAETEKLKIEHEKWMKERKSIIDARKLAIAAEKERMLHLKTLDYETRKRRLQHLSNMESSAHETLEEAAKMLQSEYERLAAQKEEALQRSKFKENEQCKMEQRLLRLRTELEARMKRQQFHDKLKVESWKRMDDEQVHEAKMQLRRCGEHALQSQENRVHQESEDQLSNQQPAKDKELLELETARRACYNEQQQFIELDHETDGQKDVSLTFLDRAERPRTQLHENDDKNPQHHSRGFTHREAGTKDADNTYRNDRTRDDVFDPYREKSRNVLANDEMEGNACEGNKILQRTSDCASHKFSIHTPMQRPFNSKSSTSVSMRRTMAETSLLEKALGNFSSSRSSSHNSMERHTRGEVALDEASSTHSIEPRGSFMVREEVNSEDARFITSLTGKQSSPQAAFRFLQVENEAIGIPQTKLTLSQEHSEETIATQAARQIAQAQENGSQLLLPFSVGKVGVTSTPEAVPDLSKVHDDELFLPRAPPNVSPAQEANKHLFTSQAAGVYTHVSNDEQSTLQAITKEDLKAEEPAYIPCVNFMPGDPDAAEQGVAPIDDRIESFDSSSEGHSNPTVMGALQRPIAELEKKLGIRFDDFSDEEEEDEGVHDSFNGLDTSEEDESIIDGRAKLLQRAKLLLEFSSFDTDSDDDL